MCALVTLSAVKHSVGNYKHKRKEGSLIEV